MDSPSKPFPPVKIVTGTCTTSGGAAQGSATPIDPVTICCM
jgi:hypothetical protein